MAGSAPRSCPGHGAQQPVVESLSKAVRRLEARLEVELHAGLRAVEARLDSLAGRLEEAGCRQPRAAAGEGSGHPGAGLGGAAGGGVAGCDGLGPDMGLPASTTQRHGLPGSGHPAAGCEGLGPDVGLPASTIRRLDAEIAALWRTHSIVQKDNRTASSLWGQISERLALVEEGQQVLAASAHRALQSSMALQRKLKAEARWSSSDRLNKPDSHAIFPLPVDFGLNGKAPPDAKTGSMGGGIRPPSAAPIVGGPHVRPASPSSSVSTMESSVNTAAFGGRPFSQDAAKSGRRAVSFWTQTTSARVKVPPLALPPRTADRPQEPGACTASPDASCLSPPPALSRQPLPGPPRTNGFGLGSELPAGARQGAPNGDAPHLSLRPGALRPQDAGTSVRERALDMDRTASAEALAADGLGACMMEAMSSVDSMKMDAVVQSGGSWVTCDDPSVTFSLVTP